MKKYELTNETKTLADGTVLHRIRALRDIPRHGVKAGDLGGLIEKENNLSQDGDAWISDDARVSGNACVFGYACVHNNARIYGYACVSGDAKIFGNACVLGDAWIFDDACVSGYACIFGDARIFGNAWISDDARVSGDACIFDDACVSGDACIFGDACVLGDAYISGNAKVSASSDYMVIKNIWSSGRWFTYTRSNKKWAVGCFYGTGEELIKKAYADSELSGRCYEAIVHAVETIEAAKAEAKGEAK